MTNPTKQQLEAATQYFLRMCEFTALDPNAGCNPELKTILAALQSKAVDVDELSEIYCKHVNDMKLTRRGFTQNDIKWIKLSGRWAIDHLHAQGYLRTPDTIPVKRGVSFNWSIGFPDENCMCLVELEDGEYCVTYYTHTPRYDTWGDKSRTGWTCLTGSRAKVKRWVKTAALADEEKG